MIFLHQAQLAQVISFLLLVFLYQAKDKPGGLTAIADKLAAAKINVTALDAVTSGDGRFGAIFWVKPEAVAKAARVLGAK